MLDFDRWFNEFIHTHTRRFPRDDWKTIDPIFWRSLATLFAKRGVTEHEAHEASARLFATQPAFIADHPAKLLAAIDAIRREHGAEAAPMAIPVTDDGGVTWSDAQADAKWDRTPEDVREHWRNEVRRKLPELCARSDNWVEGLARCWNMDPGLAACVGMPPERSTGSPPKPSEPRTSFVPWTEVVPQPQPETESESGHDQAKE